MIGFALNDLVIADDKEPWTGNIHTKQTLVSLKTDTGADLLIVSKHIYTRNQRANHVLQVSCLTTYMSRRKTDNKVLVSSWTVTSHQLHRTTSEFHAKMVIKEELFKFRTVMVRNGTGNNLLSCKAVQQIGFIKWLSEIKYVLAPQDCWRLTQCQLGCFEGLLWCLNSYSSIVMILV